MSDDEPVVVKRLFWQRAGRCESCGAIYAKHRYDICPMCGGEFIDGKCCFVITAGGTVEFADPTTWKETEKT